MKRNTTLVLTETLPAPGMRLLTTTGDANAATVAEHALYLMLARDDVVLSPHVGAFIDTAFERMAVACAQAALAGLDGRFERASVVNPSVFNQKMLKP